MNLCVLIVILIRFVDIVKSLLFLLLLTIYIHTLRLAYSFICRILFSRVYEAFVNRFLFVINFFKWWHLTYTLSLVFSYSVFFLTQLEKNSIWSYIKGYLRDVYLNGCFCRYLNRVGIVYYFTLWWLWCVLTPKNFLVLSWWCFVC